MKAKTVNAVGDYRIMVAFDDGVSGVVDLSDMVTKGIFQQLKDKDAFQHVYTDGSSIAWSDELEIDATSVYAELLNVAPSTLLSPHSFHPTD